MTELIESRLGRLEESERAALELLAAGEPLGPLILEQLTSPGSTETLERRGLVAVERHGRRLEVRLAHPLYGEVLRRQIPTLRARTVHRQLADALEAFGMHRRDDLLRVLHVTSSITTVIVPTVASACQRLSRRSTGNRWTR